ncbi:UNVERIFIED_CONTAM: hypothetical protein RMT77_003858 [Armadillidium vulgare]
MAESQENIHNSFCWCRIFFIVVTAGLILFFPLLYYYIDGTIEALASVIMYFVFIVVALFFVILALVWPKSLRENSNFKSYTSLASVSEDTPPPYDVIVESPPDYQSLQIVKQNKIAAQKFKKIYNFKLSTITEELNNSIV